MKVLPFLPLEVFWLMNVDVFSINRLRPRSACRLFPPAVLSANYKRNLCSNFNFLSILAQRIPFFK